MPGPDRADLKPALDMLAFCGVDPNTESGIASADGTAAVQVFPLRGGRLSDRHSFFLENVSGQDVESLLEAFCLEYYGNAPSIPPQIVVPPGTGELEALEQFLSDVHWGELDTLLVDMPPGTGDVSISLGQLLPRAEVVVVTTPQPAAQQVAVRAAQMARTTNMRLLGAVENMSSLVGSGEEIFGSGGGEALAAELDVPLLGKIPLDPRLRESADRGEPLVWAEPEAEASVEILRLAEAIAGTRREEGLGIVKPLPVVGASS
jgi:hypothetical protein